MMMPKKVKILVVEGDEYVRSLLHKMLGGKNERAWRLRKAEKRFRYFEGRGRTLRFWTYGCRM